MADQMNRNQQGSNFNKDNVGNNKSMPSQGQNRGSTGGTKDAGLGSQQQQRNQKGSDSGMKQDAKQNADE